MLLLCLLVRTHQQRDLHANARGCLPGRVGLVLTCIAVALSSIICGRRQPSRWNASALPLSSVAVMVSSSPALPETIADVTFSRTESGDALSKEAGVDAQPPTVAMPAKNNALR